MNRLSQQTEFGDFQTQIELAGRVCKLLKDSGISPKSIVEPSCGTGNFLLSALKEFTECRMAIGFEINPTYVAVANSKVRQAKVICCDFFSNNWQKTIQKLPEPCLVIGNPPWATNSAISNLGGSNLPVKENFQKLTGIEAITGRSNFDISESMLVYLLSALSEKKATLAMLCKTSVARKVLKFAWQKNWAIERSSMYLFDVTKYFLVAVDACLLVCSLEPRANSSECTVYKELTDSLPSTKFGMVQDQIVADVEHIKQHKYLWGNSSHRWRSGIKHDCASIMELLSHDCRTFTNKLGEEIILEPTYLYPLLKSSDLNNNRLFANRYLIVTQSFVGEDTFSIKDIAPQTWRYLISHRARLARRGSSIYRNRPEFSMFGIGLYTFTRWKVAISGFYKKLTFRCIGPIGGKPVVFDDTCYFLPCSNEFEAQSLTELLNSQTAQDFFKGFIFWDNKRPITASLLSQLNLTKLASFSANS